MLEVGIRRGVNDGAGDENARDKLPLVFTTARNFTFMI